VNDDDLKRLEEQLDVIKQRNARVEADKAWETSSFRIGSICAITYLVAAALLYVIGSERFWLGALVPTVGFLLSAQTPPALKRWWIARRYRP
jgi:hypothetical protein